MEGAKFRERRESIEKVYDQINSLIEKNSIELASEALAKSRNMLDKLSAEDLSEIQQRSTFNLSIKGEQLAKTVYKIENKNRGTFS